MTTFANRGRGLAMAAVSALVLAACGQSAPPAPEAAAPPPAADHYAGMTPAEVHEAVITLDTHLDTPALLIRPGFDLMDRNSADEDFSQVDVPRMREGGLDGGFWVIYTQQGPLTETGFDAAKRSALARAEAIQKMVADNPDIFAMATRPEDAARIAAEGKKIVYQSIENSYPLGEDLSLMQTFYDYGVRMIGPVHFRNNQFADSATDLEGPTWNGLSPLGRELVAEANRLGMILDASHAHDLVFDQLLELSATPIILSHSGPKAIYDHPRNIDDERLKKLAESGGVIAMNALGAYLRELNIPEERQTATRALFASLEGRSLTDLSAEEIDAFNARRREINAQYPAEMADFEDYMEHFVHVLKLIGPDHVAVGADWDGGGGVMRMNDVSSLPLVTERLMAEGYTAEDMEKIWSGNVLRLLAEAQAYAESVAAPE